MSRLAELMFNHDFREMGRYDPYGYFEFLTPEDFRCPDGVDPCPSVAVKNWLD